MIGKGHKRERKLGRKISNFFIYFFVLLGVSVIYYLAFSFFFDTPVEYMMKRSMTTLEQEYSNLEGRYDTLEMVLDNIGDRDREIFYALFESYPPQDEGDERRLARYDQLFDKTNMELGSEFLSRLTSFSEQVRLRSEDFALIQRRIEVRRDDMNHIPSIQPVINSDLTHIATSFGRRIHPFYRTLVQHEGIDYAVPEGTRVFATADGEVSAVTTGLSPTGQSITVTHGNGYQTVFNNLGSTLVRRGATVRRGDIIAHTGNTGLSLAPHLHYEIRYNGVAVDPVHYFFAELSPAEYERVKALAAVGMQSFD